MEVMDDTEGLVDIKADEFETSEELSNSSYNLESFSSIPAEISVSLPENSAQNQVIPIHLKQLVKDTSGYVQTIKRELHVSLDKNTGDTVIAIFDGDKRKVIRHIPQDTNLVVEKLITIPAGMLFIATA